MTKILAINGSYSSEGETDKILEEMTRTLRDSGATVEQVNLRSFQLDYCDGCHQCTQQPGFSPGACTHSDGMSLLINKIEESDAFIFATPATFGSCSAVFKRFIERLIVYTYQPWGAEKAEFRQAHVLRKRAVIVCTCEDRRKNPLYRWLFGTHKQLKEAARTVGAYTVDTLTTHVVPREIAMPLSQQLRKRAHLAARKLI